MKKILLSLLLCILSLVAAHAQTKSQVISDVVYTIEDFASDLSFINDEKGSGIEGVHSISHAFGSSEYFIYNGKQMESFAQWIEEYCFRNLQNKYVEHTFEILQKTFEKVDEDEKNDKRYRFDALLTRKSDGAVNDEKTVTFIVEWKGNNQYVSILEMKGEWYVKRQLIDEKAGMKESTKETIKVEQTNDWIGDFFSGPYFYFGVLIVIIILMFIFLPIEWCEWLVPIALGAGIFLYAWLYESEPEHIDAKILAKYDKYETVDSLKVARVCKYNKWGLINYKDEFLLPLEYQGIGTFVENMTWIQKNEKIGYINNKGEMKITPKYDGGRAFHNGQTLVYINNSSYRKGIILDKEGNVIRELPYDDIDYFKKGYAEVFIRNSGRGYIREKDYKEIIPPVYGYCYQQKYGYFNLSKDGKRGVIDSLGNVVVPFEYESVFIMDKDRIQVSKIISEKEAIIDTKGKWIVPFGRFNRIDDLVNNRIAVKNGHKWGFIDRDGKIIVPLKYNRVHSFSEGLAVVRIGQKHGCIDVNGNIIIPLMYDEIGISSQGLMTAQKGDKWGYINHNNEVVIPFRYKGARAFGSSDYLKGTALAIGEGGYGIIDRDGNTIIPFKYDNLFWRNGFYEAKEKNKKWGILDEKGNILHDFIYDEIYVTGKKIKATKDGKTITLNIPHS